MSDSDNSNYFNAKVCETLLNAAQLLPHIAVGDDIANSLYHTVLGDLDEIAVAEVPEPVTDGMCQKKMCRTFRCLSGKEIAVTVMYQSGMLFSAKRVGPDLYKTTFINYVPKTDMLNVTRCIYDHSLVTQELLWKKLILFTLVNNVEVQLVGNLVIGTLDASVYDKNTGRFFTVPLMTLKRSFCLLHVFPAQTKFNFKLWSSRTLLRIETDLGDSQIEQLFSPDIELQTLFADLPEWSGAVSNDN